MKTITIELTDAEYEIIEKAQQLHYTPIIKSEYIKRTIIEASLSTLQDAEAIPKMRFSFEPIEKRLCEKYSLDESYQKG